MAIVSFSRKFIFIKTRKTAGTSMEVQLAKYCTDQDIVTEIRPANPLHRPRYYMDAQGRTVFCNHMGALRISAAVPESSGFFKFCFERHPVDKCLSHFALLLNSPFHASVRRAKTWQEYLRQGKFPVDHGKYTDAEGRLIVDRLYRYEDLPHAFIDACARAGLPRSPLSEREKADFRYNVPSLEDAMRRSDQVQLIFDAFADTLRHVDYSPELAPASREWP